MDITFGISEKAAQRILELGKGQEQKPFLRVTVQSGGCFGFQYIFSFDTALKQEDHVFQRGDARVVVDEVSLDFLKGSEIDYQEDLMGAAFVIKNLNASGSCGCGSSFSV